MTGTETLRGELAEWMNHEGACCEEECGRQPGDDIDDCLDCRRCIDNYTAALLPIVARHMQAARADALDDVAQILPQLVDDSDPSLTALVRLVADALSVRAALTRAPRAATIRTEQEDQT